MLVHGSCMHEVNETKKKVPEKNREKLNSSFIAVTLNLCLLYNYEYMPLKGT